MEHLCYQWRREQCTGEFGVSVALMRGSYRMSPILRDVANLPDSVWRIRGSGHARCELTAEDVRPF